MGADPAFPRTSTSDVVVAGPAGTRANEFEGKDSDREPSKSIMGVIGAAGAAVQREDKNSKFPLAVYVYHKDNSRTVTLSHSKTSQKFPISP